jgi:hypothetical protein
VYALLRKAKLAEPGAAEEVARRIGEGVVSALLGRPGFRFHLGFVSEVSEAVGVTVFDDRATALEAFEWLRAWAARNLRDLTVGEPEVHSGEVVLRRGAAQWGSDLEAMLFVTIRQYEGVGPSEEALPLLAEHTLPVIEGHPGFLSFYAF